MEAGRGNSFLSLVPYRTSFWGIPCVWGADIELSKLHVLRGLLRYALSTCPHPYVSPPSPHILCSGHSILSTHHSLLPLWTFAWAVCPLWAHVFCSLYQAIPDFSHRTQPLQYSSTEPSQMPRPRDSGPAKVPIATLLLLIRVCLWLDSELHLRLPSSLLNFAEEGTSKWWLVHDRFLNKYWLVD